MNQTIFYSVFFIPIIMYFSLRFNSLNFYIFLFILMQVSGLERLLREEYGIVFLDSLIIIIIIFIILIKKVQIKFNKKYIISLLSIYAFYLFYLIFGSVNSSPDQVFEFIKLLFKNLITLLFVLILYKNIEKNKFFLLLGIIGLITSLFGIIDWYSNLALFGDRYFYRSSGYIGNANLQAQIITFMTFPIIFLLLRKQVNRYIGFFIGAVNIFGLLITQSRGGILILIIGVFLLLIFEKSISTKSKMFAIATFIVVLSTVILLINRINPLFLLRLVEGDNNGDFTNGRYDALIKGLETIFNDSIFGVGIGNSSINELNLSSHNFYVNTLVETGILFLPILIILLIFILNVTTRLLRKSDELNLIGGYLCIMLLILGFFTHNILTNPYFYILLPIVIMESGQLKTRK
ncbi:O-antigen ligase family protein [Bacillus sp. F19]|nr:O-antigen ligase family protein [Bacillus sp. F19]